MLSQSLCVAQSIGERPRSPLAGICNLCVGDGIADIIGRRFGKKKIPYNKDKSFAGSIAMGTTGFVVSVGYMYYFSMFGFVEKSFRMVVGFLVVSLASAFVESHPICTKFDDNLMVPLASVLLGSLAFSATFPRLCEEGLVAHVSHSTPRTGSC
ncbi:hypothetical protein L1987_51083 [Smallanthus sonchifolius]|uniref:Uncharacterized protein n=1 Tax=Smallanthus sonchifolius TaxID=185202 RepID=A0ACB9EPW2_9ASTR|nr:hypothetical protein L1987_51083 [Smallanthus sonchifolius]